MKGRNYSRSLLGLHRTYTPSILPTTQYLEVPTTHNSVLPTTHFLVLQNTHYHFIVYNYLVLQTTHYPLLSLSHHPVFNAMSPHTVEGQFWAGQGLGPRCLGHLACRVKLPPAGPGWYLEGARQGLDHCPACWKEELPPSPR